MRNTTMDKSSAFFMEFTGLLIYLRNTYYILPLFPNIIEAIFMPVFAVNGA
jgi:hypothetical protein